ncbi:hypothetical protein MTO96_040616 [Rhipicephalus appendiculatus]
MAEESVTRHRHTSLSSRSTRSPTDPATMIKVLILLAMLALFAVSQAVAKPQYYIADSLYYGYPYAGYYGAYYPHYYYGR